MELRYAEAWSFYRNLRRVVLALFVAALAELRMLTFLPGMLFAATFLIYFLLALWLANWRCPRCGQPFFHGAFLRSLFGGRCFHCDLPKWGVTRAGDLLLPPQFPAGWRTMREPVERSRGRPKARPLTNRRPRG